MFLRQFKIFPLKKIKHVIALHVLHHDVVVLAVLEQIDQLDYVVVLAHFENLNLSSLLSYLNRRHFFLFDSLDGHLMRV